MEFLPKRLFYGKITVMTRSHEMNMTKGPMLKKFVIYSLVLMGTNLLQVLFNVADVAILGIFSTDNAVAAVGSTSSLIHLVTGLFMGLSAGAGVILSRHAGAQNVERANRLVGTSILLSLICGVLLAVIGVVGARQFLVWMNCDAEVLDLATTYLIIYFLGMPIMMAYNFIASIMRAVGDSVRPMIYLLIGGIVNVVLNIFFILVLDMDVAGVAIATIASQLISGIISLIALIKNTGYSQLKFKYIKIYKQELVDVIKVGIPSGIQGCTFSLSNVIIQSYINAFGAVVMAGVSVASQVEQFVMVPLQSVGLACMAFVGQNYGAHNVDRIKTSIKYSMLISVIYGVVVGAIFVLLSDKICYIMTDDSEVVAYAKIKVFWLCAFSAIAGIYESLSGAMRSIGKSTTTMIICIIGVCVVRIVWMNTIFNLLPNLHMIFCLYPLTWGLTCLALLVWLLPTLKKLKASFNN